MRESSRDHGFNQVFFRLLAGLGRKLGILQYIQSLIACLVTPVFMTLFFLELKRPRPEAETPAAAERLGDRPSAETKS